MKGKKVFISLDPTCADMNNKEAKVFTDLETYRHYYKNDPHDLSRDILLECTVVKRRDKRKILKGQE